MSFDKYGKRPPIPPRPQKFPISDILKPQHPEHQDRMYSGNRPIAYLDDLKHLHNQIARWLMGNNHEFGYNGYVPLLPDGTIDPKYIKEYFVGIDAFNNGKAVGYNVKTLEFAGNLVKLFRDEDGKLVIYIMIPEASYLGDTNGKTDGNMYLVQDYAAGITSGIVPYTADVEYTGYQAGQTIKCFCPINSDGSIEFETKQDIYFADNRNTKFVVTLYNALKKPVFTVQSNRIVDNNSNVIMGDNRYCTLAVSDFTQKSGCYAGKIRLKINLASYFRTSTKFSISVTHFNTDRQIFTWNSEELFYLIGSKIDTETIDLGAKIYTNGEQGTPQLKTACGITYISKGYVTFIVTGINNLNKALIAANRIQFTSNIIDQEYEFSVQDLNFGDSIILNKDVEDVTWSHTFKLKQPWLYPTQKVTAAITISNAYDTITKQWTDVRIKYLTNNAFINSLPIPCQTTRISEGFTGTKFKSVDTTYLDSVPQNFNSIAALQQSQYLQVIPGVGLVWPNYFGVKSVAHPVRYYKCIFSGDDSDTRQVWGGTFIFGNLTLQQFNKFDFNVRISMNDGLTWYDLNTYKDGEDIIQHNDVTGMDDIIKGILCEAKEQNGQLYVRFALPEDTHYNHTDIICFKLKMHSTSTANITYIKLRNQDNTQDF